MSQADRDKWNQRYREGAYSTRHHPGVFLEQSLPELSVTPGGRAVDLACGAGRNALWLARHGWHVDAVDISEAALERLQAAADAQALPIRCIQADLEDPQQPPPVLRAGGHYQLAVLMRYTNLPLITVVTAALANGGYLIAEEHLQSAADVVGPRNPLYRVAPGALRAAADGLDIIEYREGLVTEPDGTTAALAQLVARKRAEV